MGTTGAMDIYMPSTAERAASLLIFCTVFYEWDKNKAAQTRRAVVSREIERFASLEGDALRGEIDDFLEGPLAVMMEPLAVALCDFSGQPDKAIPHCGRSANLINAEVRDVARDVLKKVNEAKSREKTDRV